MPSIDAENLVAVALVINRSRDGPALVFHYPPDVLPVAATSAPATVDETEGLLLERLSLRPDYRDLGPADGSIKLRPHHDGHLSADSASPLASWDYLAGFPARDLAGILTPARSYHKKLFKLSLDPLLCISYPLHVPSNGKWKKTKKPAKSRPRASASGPADELPAILDTGASSSSAKERDSGRREDADDEKRSSMTMFNLVFFLNPRKGEAKPLVDALFNNIVKKVNKAYNYSQQHSDFVWKESKRILAAKDRAREDKLPMTVLWKQLLQMSSLAASVQDIYLSVSQNKIATLHLETASGILSPSVQIPAPFYVADLPPEHDQRQRGLWLTTANAFLSQDHHEDPGFLDRNFALLLMDDEKKVISELQADRDPTTMSMIEFVRLAKPTMSFYQVGQSNVLGLGQVRKFAQHFIFWRRAIAIAPLHARDTYIVSPNCDLTRLAEASHDWQRTFPVAPPLSNFLAEMSVCPRPYKSFCPSKAHRPPYLRMLAWLMRGGWVTQLCTFAYVVVWPEILYEVEYEMEAEELAAAAAAEAFRAHQKEDEDALSSYSAADDQDKGAEDAGILPTVEHAAEMARLQRIALRAHQEAVDKVTSHARKVAPQATAHASMNDATHLAGLSPYIIHDANKATGKESRYLSAISRRLGDDKARSSWRRMCKYFNGQCALERIALQEDMKRKEVWSLLSTMSEYLLCTRHW